VNFGFGGRWNFGIDIGSMRTDVASETLPREFKSFRILPAKMRRRTERETRSSSPLQPSPQTCTFADVCLLRLRDEPVTSWGWGLSTATTNAREKYPFGFWEARCRKTLMIRSPVKRVFSPANRRHNSPVRRPAP